MITVMKKILTIVGVVVFAFFAAFNLNYESNNDADFQINKANVEALANFPNNPSPTFTQKLSPDPKEGGAGYVSGATCQSKPGTGTWGMIPYCIKMITSEIIKDEKTKIPPGMSIYYCGYDLQQRGKLDVIICQY